MYPPIPRGTRVKATRNPETKGYTLDGEARRELHSGKIGKVVAFADSCGLSYQIDFEIEGLAWFEPDELEIL